MSPNGRDEGWMADATTPASGIVAVEKITPVAQLNLNIPLGETAFQITVRHELR